MQLSSLIGSEIAAPADCGGTSVSGVSADSRKVERGYVFAALAGSKADGGALSPTLS
jgi:UDP-N-acetylmuramoyl-L-alanyl-D-glutamate--2,6-diaminopimelate ligase